ncbi:hypothetical protein [Streptomyces sp. H27-C3]|uniref:hypothetical protein n=1 Tax=Streptomyces sp. H27-C3 TaxID=3046305 RepID=UPI0024BA210C|nr:hypothetical protein [Streptomyces sp. H27-C3]MDJ0466827.1 hypothetical protein [Streptomyces sp. H27-C3]
MPASILDEGRVLLGTAEGRARFARLDRPYCGSSHGAQVPGDNGGSSYVRTACGHSRS